MITWVDEGGTMHYTTFGMDPSEFDRYWIRLYRRERPDRDEAFRKEPWGGARSTT